MKMYNITVLCEQFINEEIVLGRDEDDDGLYGPIMFKRCSVDTMRCLKMFENIVAEAEKQFGKKAIKEGDRYIIKAKDERRNLVEYIYSYRIDEITI